MDSFTVESHTTKNESIKNWHCKSKDVEDTKTNTNDLEVIREGGCIGLVSEKIVNCTANEDHGGIEPERSISIIMWMYTYRSLLWDRRRILQTRILNYTWFCFWQYRCQQGSNLCSIILCSICNIFHSNCLMVCLNCP